MPISRRDFLQLLAAASAGGLDLAAPRALADADGDALYDLPAFGNVSLLHITDCHAQLQPLLFREPDTNIGVGNARGHPPHLVGKPLLTYYGLQAGNREAYALTHLDFVQAARVYGKVGGFAHLATLVKRMRASRPGALLLDGGDTWQGSATALWTKGQDMVDAQLALGVDVMTGHWEFSYGAERARHVIDNDFKNKTAFVAQNIKTADFGDSVFPPYVMRAVNGIPVAVVGEAFPYTAIAHPRRFVADWTFGIQEEALQSVVDAARKNGAQVVVLLSHCGMDVDLKLAGRVRGLDAILGGHTHDAVPRPVVVQNPGGRTLVSNAGSNGKFLGVLDFEVKDGRVTDWRYRLLPVFSNLLRRDAAMDTLIRNHRAAYETQLNEVLATTEGLLYRRGNFNGTFDQVILDALMAVQDAPIAFSPGFRWGTTLLPGDDITREHLMDMTAITYPAVTINQFTGAQIKAILEDVCDNLFNPDPFLQQGGDMVRVGGLTYRCNPTQPIGNRIDEMRLNGALIDAARSYKVAGWAPVGDEISGKPVWDILEQYLRTHRQLSPPKMNMPGLVGIEGNPGLG